MAVDVFLVDDDEAVRDSLQQALELEGLRVKSFAAIEPVIAELRRAEEPLCVITDVRLGSGGGDGLQLLTTLRKHDPRLPVILITGHGDVAMAVYAMREGAHDFIEKPFSPPRLMAATRRAMDQRRLVLENTALRQQLDQGAEWGIVGHSPVIRELCRLVQAMATSQVDVLIQGETGTGKEVVARALHTASGRRGPFVAINCGALPEQIFESEMFGHESGAFTGASRKRIGKIEHADNGTVFLDEIESMPLALQAKLLRTIQERSVERLGSNELVGVNCRFIAATKVDLLEASSRGLFREDLYYRLEVATLRLPSLRERADDIPLLFNHFLAAAAKRHQVEPLAMPPEVMATWRQRSWPGNVRELRNAVERWCLRLDQVPMVEEATASLGEMVTRFERGLVESALRKSSGSVQLAADALGVPRKTLYDKLARLNIDISAVRTSGG
jgi:two-component system, NtrC family, C4-dicarboxylate transport response regulator DctD